MVRSLWLLVLLLGCASFVRSYMARGRLQLGHSLQRHMHGRSIRGLHRSACGGCMHTQQCGASNQGSLHCITRGQLGQSRVTYGSRRLPRPGPSVVGSRHGPVGRVAQMGHSPGCWDMPTSVKAMLSCPKHRRNPSAAYLHSPVIQPL